MKKDYISPKLRTVDAKSRYGLLQHMSYGNGTIGDEGDIGFSKGHDLDDEDTGGDKGVWED